MRHRLFLAVTFQRKRIAFLRIAVEAEVGRNDEGTCGQAPCQKALLRTVAEAEAGRSDEDTRNHDRYQKLDRLFEKFPIGVTRNDRGGDNVLQRCGELDWIAKL